MKKFCLPRLNQSLTLTESLTFQVPNLIENIEIWALKKVDRFELYTVVNAVQRKIISTRERLVYTYTRQTPPNTPDSQVLRWYAGNSEWRYSSNTGCLYVQTPTYENLPPIERTFPAGTVLKIIRINIRSSTRARKATEGFVVTISKHPTDSVYNGLSFILPLTVAEEICFE